MTFQSTTLQYAIGFGLVIAFFLAGSMTVSAEDVHTIKVAVSTPEEKQELLVNLRNKQIQNRRKVKDNLREFLVPENTSESEPSQKSKEKIANDNASTENNQQKSKLRSAGESVSSSATTLTTNEDKEITKKQFAEVAFRLTNIADRLQSRMILLEHQGYTLPKIAESNLDTVDELLHTTSEKLRGKTNLTDEEIISIQENLEEVKTLLFEKIDVLKQLLTR